MSTSRTYLPLISTAPAAGCDCLSCPWYSGDDADPAVQIAPLCSGSNADCSYCGCSRTEAGALASALSPCDQCPVRCGSRTDIDEWMSALRQTLEFSDISEITTALPAKLPRFIPMIDGSDVREWDKHLNWPAYGVGLRRVFSPTTHQLFPKFSGADVHDVLGLKNDQLAVLVGYGEDPLVEGFWTRRTSENLVERIVEQGWDVVLAPNYSIYGNWPRAQHLISMRMSLLLAAEFAQTGVPTVPNVYWYRLEDLQRWGEWMTQYQPTSDRDQSADRAAERQLGQLGVTRSALARHSH